MLDQNWPNEPKSQASKDPQSRLDDRHFLQSLTDIYVIVTKVQIILKN